MADRYWVGGTATWDGTAGTKWSTASGGAGGAAVPTSADDVFIDANSGTGTISLSATFNDAVCNNLTLTGFTGTLDFGASGDLAVHGNLTIPSGCTVSYSGDGADLRLSGGSTQLVTTNGKALPWVNVTGTGTIASLQDELTAEYVVVASGGTLQTNDYDINSDTNNVLATGGLSVDNATISLGSSTLSLDELSLINNNTISTNTSTINIRQLANLNKSKLETVNITTATTANVGDGGTIDNLTISGGGTVYFENSKTFIVLSSLTMDGITLESDFTGSEFTLASLNGVVSATSVTLKDCHASNIDYTLEAGTFNIDTLTGAATTLSLTDDAATDVALPFTFPFYDGSYTSVSVGSNGLLRFDGSASSSGGQYGTALSAPSQQLIAALWADLDPSAGGTIKHETFGSVGSRRFVVSYDSIPNYDDPAGASYTFQAKLFEADNAIELHVQDSRTATYNFVQGVSDGVRETYKDARNESAGTGADITNEVVVFEYTIGTAEFIADTSSTDNGNTTGWTFAVPQPPPKPSNMLLRSVG